MVSRPGKKALRPAEKGRAARMSACALAAVMAASCVPAGAAEPIGDGVTSTYDEAYYATVDYYGNLQQGSVVKSYALNGASSITDYGTYDEVENLTDGRSPTVHDGATTFTFGNDAPDRFYFEGITARPFGDLPWTISMSYTLNGVPTKAEDLAGKTGEVEINLNFVPNQNASDYAKDNYTLEAMAAFNADDIQSLEAQGAQVQLIGNLRVVLFLALPGEEQHFTIRVGSNDFSFDGMTYLMMPATLSQLDEIAKLGKKKDDLEENYDKLNSSLDTLLDSMNGMSGSLYDTADGLDELNKARGTISAGKDGVYAGADTVLGDLDSLNHAMDTLSSHTETASQAVSDVTDSLTQVTDTAVSLKSNLSSLRTEIGDVQDDVDDVRASLTENGPSLQDHLDTLGQDINALESSLSSTNDTINDFELSVGGDTLSLEEAVQKANGVLAVYQNIGAGQPLTMDQFFLAAQYLQNGAVDSATAQANAEQLLSLLAYPTMDASNPYYSYWCTAQGLEKIFDAASTAKSTGADATLDQTEFLAAALLLAQFQEDPTAIDTITSAENVTTAKSNAATLGTLQSQSQSGLYGSLSNLCSILGTNGISGDLSDLTELTSQTLGDLNDLGTEASALTKKADTLLDEVQALDDTLNRYVPDLKQTLTDTKTLADTVSSTVKDTKSFLTTFESLLKTVGTQLDSGTEKTLTGMAAALRQAAKSLGSTGDVKSAKSNINDIIKDTWKDYTGDVNNLLLMDSTADAVSLTSVKNPSPESIQVMIRSQEIKVADEKTQSEQTQKTDHGTFFSRIGAMFKGIGSFIAGIFKH